MEGEEMTDRGTPRILRRSWFATEALLGQPAREIEAHYNEADGIVIGIACGGVCHATARDASGSTKQLSRGFKFSVTPADGQSIHYDDTDALIALYDSRFGVEKKKADDKFQREIDPLNQAAKALGVSKGGIQVATERDLRILQGGKGD